MAFDLRSKDLLRYDDTPAADPTVRREFAAIASQRLRSPLPEQRTMLEAAHPFPAYILAAPRVPTGPRSRHHYHPRERRTFGDHVRAVGILTAYGNMFGAARRPELVHAK